MPGSFLRTVSQGLGMWMAPSSWFNALWASFQISMASIIHQWYLLLYDETHLVPSQSAMWFAPSQWCKIADFRFSWLACFSLFVLERVLQKSPFHTLFMSSFPTSKSLACLTNMCFAPREVLDLVDDVTLLLTVRFVLGSYCTSPPVMRTEKGGGATAKTVRVNKQIRKAVCFRTSETSWTFSIYDWKIATKIGNIHTGVTSTVSAILQNHRSAVWFVYFFGILPLFDIWQETERGVWNATKVPKPGIKLQPPIVILYTVHL